MHVHVAEYRSYDTFKESNKNETYTLNHWNHIQEDNDEK